MKRLDKYDAKRKWWDEEQEKIKITGWRWKQIKREAQEQN